jgi:hypothetical protein
MTLRLARPNGRAQPPSGAGGPDCGFGPDCASAFLVLRATGLSGPEAAVALAEADQDPGAIATAVCHGTPDAMEQVLALGALAGWLEAPWPKIEASRQRGGLRSALADAGVPALSVALGAAIALGARTRICRNRVLARTTRFYSGASVCDHG